MYRECNTHHGKNKRIDLAFYVDSTSMYLWPAQKPHAHAHSGRLNQRQGDDPGKSDSATIFNKNWQSKAATSRYSARGQGHIDARIIWEACQLLAVDVRR